jgi:ribosomal protein L7/L12
MEDAPSDSPEPEADTPQAAAMEQIVEALRQGNKIQAIKDYRELTGSGLKESKEAIEALIEKYEIPMKSGCASLLLFALSSTLLLLLVWLQR